MNGAGSSNPYVTLGIPFGASRDMASLAFAQRAKSLRRKPGGAEQLTELTWALNQVTDVLRDPDAAVDIYRVPADPAALEPEGDGLFQPLPERMARSTEPAQSIHDSLRLQVAREAAQLVATTVGDQMRFPNR